jgi:deazaflavin-dependent oxidoreductase (nitroreductase family)
VIVVRAAREPGTVEVAIMTTMTTTTEHQAPKVPRWVNATMRWILRSPFSRMVDRGIVLLTVTGRRTGRRFSFPVQYVQEGDVLWVMSGAGPGKTWWRNLVGAAPVKVLLRRHAFDATADVSTYTTDPETVIQGVHRYMARFPRFEKKFGLADGNPEAFDVFARDTVIVRVRIRS